MDKYNEHYIIDKIIEHKKLGLGVLFIGSLSFLYLLFLIMMGLYTAF